MAKSARTIEQEVTNGRRYSDGTILIKNVRFSYVHAAEPWGKKPTDTKKYSVTGLLPKKTHKAVRDLLNARINELMADIKVPRMETKDKFLRNGDDSKHDEYAGHWTVACSETKRPSIRGKDAKPIDRADIAEEVQSGYWGDLLIRPWAQNNEHGQKINAGFVALQVKKEDETFGMGGVSEEDIDETFDADDDDGGYEDDDDDL